MFLKLFTCKNIYWKKYDENFFIVNTWNFQLRINAEIEKKISDLLMPLKHVNCYFVLKLNDGNYFKANNF